MYCPASVSLQPVTVTSAAIAVNPSSFLSISPPREFLYRLTSNGPRR